MQKKWMAAAMVAVILTSACAEDKQTSEATTAPVAALDTQQQKVSYVFGLNLAQQLGTEQIDVDVEALSQGLSDGLAGTEPRLGEEELMLVMQTFQQQQQEKMAKQAEEREAARKLVAETNKQEGETFLMENGSKEGVVTTESGLQYKVLTAGTGPSPTAEDTVTVHYRGTLLDGTEFDSSYARGEPVSFPVSGVIPGWTEALQLMKEGAKWTLYIPSELAYGPGGAGAQIGPNATLVFDVELLKASAGE